VRREGTGGVDTPVVVIGKTAVAARLLRYTEKEKAGGTEPRVLYSEGIRCRVPTAEREFAMTRRMHGKQGAKRKVPAKYELPEPGEVTTHVRRTRPNGRKYWAAAGDSETATHVRRDAGGYVDEIQAVHVIVSFGLDEVNPDDSEQVRRTFGFVANAMSELYPGVQMKLVGQADGMGKAFHVHCVQNAVIAEAMEVDGHIWVAGRKMSGALTDINRLRERVDEFIELHGASYGVEQKLPTLSEQRVERRNARDRRMAARGEISNHDIIRAAFEDSMDDVRAVDLDSFIAVMFEHEVTVKHRVTRAGKPSEEHALSYQLVDMSTPVRGSTLGDHYAYQSTVEQLNDNAVGLPRKRRPATQHAGTPKPCPSSTPQELADAEAVVERLAVKERAAQINDQMDIDLLPAMIEDLDAAVEAKRIGDFQELSRLANSTRAKEAQRRAQARQTTATSSPVAESAQPPFAAPANSILPPNLKPDAVWRERAHAALQEAGAQGQALSDRMISDHLREKEAAKTANLEHAAESKSVYSKHNSQTKPAIIASPTSPQYPGPGSQDAAERIHEPEETRAVEPETEAIAAEHAAGAASIAEEVSPHLLAARKRLSRLRRDLDVGEIEGEPSVENPSL
jgi:hypothetical protein